MTCAFVLGNGRSRLEINPLRLKEIGKVYGCNAIYRDSMPDYLIAVDSKMVLELVEHNVPQQTEVWTNYNQKYKTFTGLNYFQPSKGWSSGPTALWFASQQPYQTIYILGFDYKGIGDGKVNNVYTDTFNYKTSNQPATYYGNWSKQTETVIKEFPSINYVRVVNDDYLDLGWEKYDNFKHMTYDEFKKQIFY